MVYIMNFRKTHVLINKYFQNRDAVIHYVYFGQQGSTNPSMEEQIKRRTRLGWKAFGRDGSTFKSNDYINVV